MRTSYGCSLASSIQRVHMRDWFITSLNNYFLHENKIARVLELRWALRAMLCPFRSPPRDRGVRAQGQWASSLFFSWTKNSLENWGWTQAMGRASSCFSKHSIRMCKTGNLTEKWDIFGALLESRLPATRDPLYRMASTLFGHGPLRIVGQNRSSVVPRLSQESSNPKSDMVFYVTIRTCLRLDWFSV